MGIKMGPIENLVGEEVVKCTYHLPVENGCKRVNDNLVLEFKSGRRVFISSLMATILDSDTSVLFFSPEDENGNSHSEPE